MAQNVIDKYWRLIETGLGEFTIPGRFPESGQVQFENLRLKPMTQKPDLSKLFNSIDNTMHFGANSVKFYANADIIISQFSKVATPVRIYSTLTGLSLTSKFETVQKDQGDIPKLTFSDAKAQVSKHLEISSKAFIFKDILAMITNNWFGLRDTLIKTLNTALSNPASYTQFNKYLNDALMTGYPTY